MNKIKWAEIEAECGSYRAGFVSVFRKYEGQMTDEKDKQGRVVKVTATSFARHLGIPDRTFRYWVKQDGRPGRIDDQRDRAQEQATKALADPKQRKKVIEELDDEALDAIRQDISEKEAREVEGPDWEEKQRRRDERWQKYNKETKARQEIDKALWALRARLEFYGDVPLTDSEKETLPLIRMVLERLEAGAEMDDELKELITDAENTR